MTDETPPFTTTAHGPLADPPRRLTQPRQVPEGATEIQAAINEAVTGARMTFVQQTEEQLKDVVRAALKLVEENPRHEPMRAEIGRPAVERMLAEDVRSVQEISVLLSNAEQGRLVTALFDLGWRPTIDRLVR